MKHFLFALLFLCGVMSPPRAHGQISFSGVHLNGGVGGSTNVCGPPNFDCSSKSTAVITQPSPPAMAAINATGYAYTAPTDPYYPVGGHGNCYTALSDATQRGGVSLHASWSGGGGNGMSDIDEVFFAGTDDNGAVFYFRVHYDANGCMQMDSDMSKTSPSGGTQGGFIFSRATAARAYKIAPAGKEIPGDATTGTNLYQEDLSYNSSTHVISVARTLLFNYNNCPGLDGTLNVQGGNGNLNVDSADRFYSTTLNFPPATNGQDGAHWALVWDRTTNTCATYYTGVVQNAENPANGNIWAFCLGNCSQHGSNPAPLALNTTCDPLGYGVHDSIGMMNGLYMNISGKCIAGSNGGTTVWRFGANDIRTCNTTLNNCGGHGAFGYNKIWSYNNNVALRDVSDLTTFTVVHALFQNGMDQHGATNWIGTAADTNPWMTSAHANTLSNSCATLVYCNELLAIRQDGVIVRFGPNFHQWTGAANDLGPIPAVTQRGRCFVFESTWNGTRGIDGSGNLKKDLFSICNLR